MLHTQLSSSPLIQAAVDVLLPACLLQNVTNFPRTSPGSPQRNPKPRRSPVSGLLLFKETHFHADVLSRSAAALNSDGLRWPAAARFSVVPARSFELKLRFFFPSNFKSLRRLLFSIGQVSVQICIVPPTAERAEHITLLSKVANLSRPPRSMRNGRRPRQPERAEPQPTFRGERGIDLLAWTSGSYRRAVVSQFEGYKPRQ